MNILTKGFSILQLTVIALAIITSVISTNLQDHSQMMAHGSCETSEECIFHQAISVFKNNLISNNSPLQLIILLVGGLLLFVSSNFDQKLNTKKFYIYHLQLLRYKDKWSRYLQRSIDKLKIHILPNLTELKN